MKRSRFSEETIIGLRMHMSEVFPVIIHVWHELKAMEFQEWLLITKAPKATLLIRLMVGIIFLEEGIQKFLFPDLLGTGRFARIGIPFPDVMGPFVGAVEIVCGALILVGLLTRLASIPLLIDISMAILSTKIPIWAGHDVLWFHLPKFARYGFWSMANEARTDFSMLLGLLFLLAVGAGPYSMDARISRRLSEKSLRSSRKS